MTPRSAPDASPVRVHAPPSAEASGRGQWAAYAFCNVGVAVGGVPTTLLLLYYLTEVAGLKAGLAGLIIALPKVWDALVDPLFGGWVDRLSVKLGRRWPVTLVAGAAYVGSLAMMFSLPPLPLPGQALLFGISVLIVSSVSQTALGVTQFAMATEISHEPVGLSRLLMLSAVAAQVCSIAVSIAAPVLVSASGGGAAGYAAMAAEVGALSALALAFFAWATRRVPVRVADPAEHERSLASSIRATFTNRAFYGLVVFVISQTAGAAIIFGTLPFANQHVLVGSSGDLAVIEGILGVTVLTGMLLAPRCVRLFGAMRSMRDANIAGGVALALLFAAGFGPRWASWVVVTAIGLSAGVIGVLVQTAALEIARRKLGTAAPVSLGFYLGILLSAVKLGGSLGALVAGQWLDLIGFVPGGAVQSSATVWGLRGAYTVAPLLFVLLGGWALHHVMALASADGRGQQPMPLDSITP